MFDDQDLFINNNY